ncbi:phospholipase D-like protein [Nitrospirillum amazonense]|uniref:Phospholipase D-like protein n=1 Tax=Nitrospirillum amazonense TaxID=28077 RepID=A0A560K6W2_9PROT|nr:phospholipase D-like domain-containing protein [Nitrospirillum amazonense]TWB77564.1 phospholipase D-like protein [Nitrospirillum amazonense]
MKLILNGINGEYLRQITDNYVVDTRSVDVAVAYVTDETLLFDWCWKYQIPLRFWGRYDASVPVALRVLKGFLDRKSPNYSCKLLTHFHSKVIWWHGVGVYIGSANLTDPAWHGNVEAGCFFNEEEIIASGMDRQIDTFFREINTHASPLTEELYREIEERSKQLQRIEDQDRDNKRRFSKSVNIHHWDGLIRQSALSAREQQRRAFLDEWNSTLQTLRDIGHRVSTNAYRPKWIPADTPGGAQADQFLHAFYDCQVIGEDRRSQFAEMHDRNKGNPESALQQAMAWWRDLTEPPTNEAQVLLDWAPVLRNALSENHILNITEEEFKDICERVWSIQDHARRVSNETVGLSAGQSYTMEIKTTALAKYLYSRKSKNGSSVIQVINHILYDGRVDEVPNRLWDAIAEAEWRIDHLGISALGEMIGWALPNDFPPRNNRTSKALRALGFPVDYVG